jgi:phi13 family phage major tail protein
MSKVTVDGITGVPTYGTVESIPFARQLGYEEGVKSGSLWGDGKPAFIKRKRGDQEVELEVAGLSMTQESAMFGATTDPLTGIVTEAVDDTPPWYALGWIEELPDDSIRAHWALWGEFEPAGEEYETYQGEVSFKTRKVKYKGMPRPIDGKLRIKADENEIPGGATLDEFFTAATLNASLPVVEGA